MNNQSIVLDQRPDKNINNLQDISNKTKDLTMNRKMNSRPKQRSDRSLCFRIYARIGSLNYSTGIWVSCLFISFTIIATLISVLIICFTINKSSR
jgi:uncharacterized membrane protein